MRGSGGFADAKIEFGVWAELFGELKVYRPNNMPIATINQGGVDKVDLRRIITAKGLGCVLIIATLRVISNSADTFQGEVV